MPFTIVILAHALGEVITDPLLGMGLDVCGILGYCVAVSGREISVIEERRVRVRIILRNDHIQWQSGWKRMDVGMQRQHGHVLVYSFPSA